MRTPRIGRGIAAVLLSVGLCFTRVRGRLRGLLILAASGGAALDVGSWFLTRQWGEPFHLLVMAGGGLFGVSTGIMALAILRDALAGGVQAESDAAA